MSNLISNTNAFFLRQSSKVGNSVLDWIRSIYFSLFGSSLLAFALKCSTYNYIAIVLYLIGTFFLLLGLFLSVKITKRFKGYEKSWPEDVIDRTKKPLSEYYKENDETKAWQHSLVYSIWIPSIICIGLAGLNIEREISLTMKQANQTNLDSVVKYLHQIEIKLDKSINNNSSDTTFKTHEISSLIISH